MVFIRIYTLRANCYQRWPILGSHTVCCFIFNSASAGPPLKFKCHFFYRYLTSRMALLAPGFLCTRIGQCVNLNLSRTMSGRRDKLYGSEDGHDLKNEVRKEHWIKKRFRKTLGGEWYVSGSQSECRNQSTKNIKMIVPEYFSEEPKTRVQNEQKC